MMQFGTSRRQQRNEEARRHFMAMPMEGKIATVAAPVCILLFTNGLSMFPSMREALGGEQLAAAGSIMAILSFLFVQRLFAPIADKRVKELEERDAILKAAAQVAERPSASAAPRVTTLSQVVTRLQQHDPGFSERILLAHSRALLVHIATNPGMDAALAPFITPHALRTLRDRLGNAQRVLAGPSQVFVVTETEVWTSITIRQPFLVDDGTAPRLVRLTWTLRRSSAARSRAPADRYSFGCPACGTPIEVSHPDGTCTTCQTAITHGQLDWQVTEVMGAAKGDFFAVDERFTGSEHPSLNLRTAESFSLDADLRSFSGRHPDLSIAAVERLAGQAALAWFAGLSRADADLRPLDDNCQQSLHFERERFAAAGLAVHSGPAAVDQIEWARATQDGWHELADLRVFLTLPWHLTSANGHTLDGSAEHPRSLSVYVRLAHRTQEHAPIEGWRAWQVLDARHYEP